ncbi:MULTISPECIES: DNA replication/repair protein RecF [unclassified Sphingobium]|uniref:DNA replication/repair protein RecF n=1 Tax=unclassified Sphingobium TaxID=2611147 RepID=UPI00222480C4|nr:MULTISPECIES: DNA replication/repair protein RecF [unclassified Sphingobium]MCW2395418.1 DNA replication and repair protein RecF [Sphingobium sp. B8D3B]MCW2418933.1 DNA replication and repair protein RecF [Sphingobium sp. B8D3C]
MAIDRLALTNFRNHADALIVPDAPMIVLTGENGAGKTNILEAISLLAPGRGLRGAALRDMARQSGPGGFAVAARLGDAALGTGTDPEAPDKRQVRIDGRASPANALSARVSLSWLTPAMDRLFLDSPGGRRRFLDRLVLAQAPSHAHHSARYEAAMRARNALLGEDGPADPDWLAALEARMAEHGAAIDVARRALIAELEEEIARSAQHLFARPTLRLTGEPFEEGTLAARLRSARTGDRAAGRTLVGPHRADLLVTHEAKQQDAALCSTGEQKALLLSIMLAHAQLVGTQSGRPLIILLDEVAAHLDPTRRHALFERLRASGGQVWMTGTEADLFNGLDQATYLRVEAGQVITG